LPQAAFIDRKVEGWDFVTQSPAGGLNPTVFSRCV